MSKIWEPILREAYKVALKSPDPSTQNGALLARMYSWGSSRLEPTSIPNTKACNEFPVGVKYTEARWERPLKYQVIEHAERNSIYAAAFSGIPTQGLTMVCSWATCADCARAIIQSGITRLVTHKQAYDRSTGAWKDSIAVAFEMLEEAQVEIVFYDGKLNADPIRHSGEIWTP